MYTTMLTLFTLPLLFTTIFSPSTGQMPTSDNDQGEWHLLQGSIGISAMHMQLLRNDKVVIFDRTDFGRSNLTLSHGQCRHDPNEQVVKTDCTAHSIMYDIGSNTFRPLMVQTDTWCSSGAVLPNGTLIQTGGYNDGDHVVRTLTPCEGEDCDWVEFTNYLARRRWYSSNQILPDGRIIIVGGRSQFNYEFYPEISRSSPGAVRFGFLRETSDSNENNLYPFLHLLPSGNLFIFANTRSIVFDYQQNRILREYPTIPGGDPRNYPSTGSSVLLPMDENAHLDPEIMICGGAPYSSFQLVNRGHFRPATSNCGRLKVNNPNPTWEMENMPMSRVMSDMLILPSGDVIIINGAHSGTAGWEASRDPATHPLVYRPNDRVNNRFSIMTPSTRPRLYHSSAILLTDGRILVGGSNPHRYYNFTDVEFPTDLSLESFSPPYLSPHNDGLRPRVTKSDENITYRKAFYVTFTLSSFQGNVTVRLVAPSFTTHSFSMNQRMIILKAASQVQCTQPNIYSIAAIGPSTVEVAPPGYYLLFVVHTGIPSSGVWVRVQ